MSRRIRVPQPPNTANPELDRWLLTLTNVMNQFPNFSIISTSDGPESVETASPGVLAIDVGSSNTTFWVKTSTETTIGWQSLGLGNNPSGLGSAFVSAFSTPQFF